MISHNVLANLRRGLRLPKLTLRPVLRHRNTLSRPLSMKEFLNIPYTQPSRGLYNEFDLYVPPSPQPLPLLCFVHGGAWRAEDKADHADLARRLAQLTSCPVAVPNYRLTKPETPLLHPGHAQDLLQFLQFALDWDGPDGIEQPYDSSRIYAFGHSCSAHMLTSILLAPTSGADVLTPSPKLLAAVRGIVLSEGIYDIDLLLRSFPPYKKWFIANTFGDLPSYEAFNTANYRFREGGEHINWLVIHSEGDTLVDKLQADTISARLQHLIDAGKGSGSVETNWELMSEHNAILKEEGYPEIVNTFVRRNENDL